MNTGCRTFLFSMVFFLAAGAACAGENASPGQAPAAPGATVPSRVVENSTLGASFIDAAKAKPGRHGTQTMIVEGINDQGWIVGRWTDSKGQSHRFLMNLFLPAFSDIANHGATSVQVWTVSDTGQLTLDTDKSGYITCMKVNGGQCGSHASFAAIADGHAPGFSPALCSSGCSFAEMQATVQ
jgi:hypothetical protein